MEDWDLSHAEGQRAQRIFRSCDFARRIAEGVGIGGLGDWDNILNFQASKLKIAVEKHGGIVLATKDRRNRRKSQNLKHLSFRWKKRYQKEETASRHLEAVMVND